MWLLGKESGIWKGMMGRNHPTHERGGKVTRKLSGDHDSIRLQNVRDMLTDQIDTVINCTPIRVKIKSKLTKLMKISRIEGYNGKYGSNPHGIRKISDDLFKFDQIGQWTDDRNWGKWYFMKENFKTIPQNQKSLNLTLILLRNWRSKWWYFSEIENHELTENKLEIKLNY